MTHPKPGDVVRGFDILTVARLDEYNAVGVLAKHRGTGCEVYHVVTDDRDNLFAFAFKTLPEDDSGVAHILEHSVLCGSKDFPAKDPFLLLLKGSMNTYMNAFTFPDKTVYPASSQVEKDFYNLFRVYGDAVFFPLLRREAFMQEGHRREFGADGRLDAVGIVYNEMKGNYSSHDSIASEWAYRSLFPGSPYSFDSGGEPGSVLGLGYDAFVAFHRKHYHPSNCRVFLYGNIPTERHLGFLEDNFLSRFSAGPEIGDIAPVERWDAPRFLERTYPAGEGETVEGSSSVTVNWLLFPVTDPLKVLAFEILSEVLLGNAGSPLEKALVESGLGEDLSPATGIETETLELTFSVGLRGTSPAKRGKIESLVFDVLRGLVEKGIEREQIEGALRRVEFRSREIKAGAAFGMRLMRRSLRGWLHGGSPELTMNFRDRFEELKRAHAADPRFFEKLIAEYLLDNPHRTTLVVKPDPELARRQEEEIRGRLDAEARALSGGAKAELEAALAAFRAFQESPDSPEARASIPSLALSDVPREVERIPAVPYPLTGVGEAWGHDLFTNGIVYADFAFDLAGAGEDLFMYLPLYAMALTGIGAGGRPYDRMALELSLKTGGFSAQVEAATTAGRDPKIRRFLFLRIKCLEPLLRESLDLLGDLLLDPDLGDEDRLRDILLEYRNELKSAIVPSGHSFASSRAERGLSQSEYLEELWKGVSQYLFVSRLSGGEAVKTLASKFREIRDSLLVSGNLKANFTCPEAFWPEAGRAIEGFAARLPRDSAGARADAVQNGGAVPRIEGLAVPSSVGFVATAVPAARFGSREHAHETVLAHLLSTGRLWESIRMKGGAYGAFSVAMGREAVFSFASYRDPNVASTLDAFRTAIEEIAVSGVDELSAKDSVIGTVAKDMKPLSPSGKSIVAFKRTLYGVSDELRESQQAWLLGTSREDLRKAAERLRDGFSRGYSAVIAGKGALDEASSAYPGLAENRIEIPL